MLSQYRSKDWEIVKQRIVWLGGGGRLILQEIAISGIFLSGYH